MHPHSRLSYAVAAVLGAGASGQVIAANAADANSAVDQIQEITVTAQRRSENVQNVPIAIQALTGETLAQLNVTTFDDLIKYLPNVTAPTAGPGQAQIFMRGLSAGSNGTQSGGSINGFPNVAVYLDDQSGQLPGRNLDVYAADLERVEVLEGLVRSRRPGGGHSLHHQQAEDERDGGQRDCRLQHDRGRRQQ
jgi:iron complex outermembrane receptor protein